MNTYCKKPLRLFGRTGGAENAVNKKEKSFTEIRKDY
jgi:hypothetical protein